MSNLKNWTINKDSNYLIHTCQITSVLNPTHAYGRKEEGRWICRNCKEIAPEPIQLIADLCKCKSYESFADLLGKLYSSEYFKKIQKEVSPIYSMLKKDYKTKEVFKFPVKKR